ncbi:helix-turn-helix transcriptional regulator [Pedobacter heparinus]|uniref:helix-turn-helix domain-containing protein n=1 Tax=Pedobacter heparinus TaxID=984 RepID=UPI00292E2224|nr:helix-turn-helix transcriptional regulator [Pedobacter heparinus]
MKDTIISQKIRALRKKRHWSQTHMAALLGISVPAYSKIECAFTEVSVSRLKLLAGIFEVKASWLLDEEEAVIKIENEELKEKLNACTARVMLLQRKLLEQYEEGQNNHSLQRLHNHAEGRGDAMPFL